MIKVQNVLTVYEIDSAETMGTDEAEIVVKSHWNKPDLVTLVIGGKKWVVSADDLRAAISNATNSGIR